MLGKKLHDVFTKVKRFVKPVSVTTLGVVAVLSVSASMPVNAQQASLTLTSDAATVCNYTNTTWDLDKNGQLVGTDTVQWNVTVTKVNVSNNYLVLSGNLTIFNGGSAGATIGNIVTNLQKRSIVSGKEYWISAAANVADSSHGDSATTDKIVAKASQENPSLNASNGPGNYTISNGVGTFIETSGSGTLEFTDANSNTIWAITPQQTIAPGATVNLIYEATFNNSLLGLQAGASIRIEAIVSFGNAGPRGGSGASLQNVDISGDGSIQPDEKYVRSVPSRKSLTVPTLIECNRYVTLTDKEDDLSKSENVSYSFWGTDVGGGSGIEEIDGASLTAGGTIIRHVSVTVANDSENDGTIKNCASLASSNDSGCCEDFSMRICYEVTVPGSGGGGGGGGGDGIGCGDYTTYSQGGYGQDWTYNKKTNTWSPPNGGPGKLLADNFATVYPSGIEIGIPGSGGYSIKLSSAKAVGDYLPGNGTPGALTADLVDPTSSSSGTFGGQVLTMKINVDLSAAGKLGNVCCLGNLYYCDASSSLHGQTISQIIAAANTALGGGALPSGYSYSSLTDLLDNLVQAFHPDSNGSCVVSPWAHDHLRKTPCP